MINFNNINELDMFKHVTDLNPILVYIGGSRTASIVDSRSDVDVIVVLDDLTYLNIYGDSVYENVYANFKFDYKGKEIQFIIIREGYIRDITAEATLTIIGMVQLYSFDESHILYTTVVGNNLVSFILNNKKEISKLYSHKLRTRLQTIVDKACDENILEANKCVYHLVYSAQTLKNEIIDIYKLSKLKRIKYNVIDKDVETFAINNLKYLKNYSFD